MSRSAPAAGPQPRALAFGLALLVTLPFLWSLAGHRFPAFTAGWAPLMFNGKVLAVTWGSALLFFCAGARAGMGLQAKENPVAVLLVALPALFAYVMVQDASDASMLMLAAAWIGLFAVEIASAKGDITPSWWFAFRLPVTVLACLALVIPLL